MEWLFLIGVVLLFSGLLWYISNLLIKKQSPRVAAIGITAVFGSIFLFFVVFAMIKAKEAQQQVEMAEKMMVIAQQEAQWNAEEATRQAEMARSVAAEARTQQRLAQEANKALKECQNSK